MARIRTIKPEFWEDEKLAELPFGARLLFIGSWNFADDNGVLPNSIKWIKAKIFPYDSLRDNEVSTWCDALTKNRMLVPFTFEGKGYLYIRRFTSHQIVDKRYTKEIIPAEALKNLIEESQNTTCSHSDHIVTTPQEMEGKGNGNGNGKERKERAKRSEVVNPFSENFTEIWSKWKDYKKAEFKFTYKSAESEQSALNELVNLSAGNEQTAAAIIFQSMSKGWKGLFELKNVQNGNSKTQKAGNSPVSGESLNQAFADFYSQK